MGQDLYWDQYIDNKFQYLQQVATLWICVLIFDAMIPNKLSF